MRMESMVVVWEGAGFDYSGLEGWRRALRPLLTLTFAQALAAISL